MTASFTDLRTSRHAVKVFDTEYKIPREELLSLIDEASTAPSSVNMQPWRVLVVDTPEGKEKLRPFVRFNTRQNDTSSAMIVLMGDTRCHDYAEEITQKQVDQGLMPAEVRSMILDAYLPYYEQADHEKMTRLLNLDCGLWAMQFMLAARERGLDTCPMGGFDRYEALEAFGIDTQRYMPIMLIAVGKSNYTSHPTLRLEAERITQFA